MTRLAVRLPAMLAALVPAALAVAQSGMVPASPAHKQMARDVGQWEGEFKMWMDPAADPIVSKATETSKMLGDYWLQTEFSGEIGDQKFAGRGMLGYDPESKKFVGTWCDTMTPYMSIGEGEYDVDKHALTMTYKARDPMTREMQSSKMVTTFVDDDTKQAVMYSAPDDAGKSWKMMEITYKRKK
ncbi:MAG: DUF1579 domain-containing protein [Pirellulales bacterium]|nr:DUF1579 domain-containing protein [Pirellulales bacterium]